MIASIAAALVLAAPAPAAREIIVCGRSMSFADQHCAAMTEGRRWGHAEAAAAHEAYARFALPHKAAESYVAAANNWIMAGQPERAATALDRARAAEASEALRVKAPK